MSEPTPEVEHAGLTCSECGNHEPLRWNEQRKAILIERGVCFNCCFWLEKVDMADQPNVVRTDRAWHYVIGADQPRQPAHTKGCGGHKWTVRFFDGREVATDNLWVQGEIPERFRDRLPPNADLDNGYRPPAQSDEIGTGDRPS